MIIACVLLLLCMSQMQVYRAPLMPSGITPTPTAQSDACYDCNITGEKYKILGTAAAIASKTSIPLGTPEPEPIVTTQIHGGENNELLVVETILAGMFLAGITLLMLFRRKPAMNSEAEEEDADES